MGDDLENIKKIIGTKINKYEIVKYINSGSFGHVFKARINDNSFVALKIPVKTLEKDGQSSLCDEFKIYKNISNPEKGVANMKMTVCKDQKIIVMDLLGPSLENILSKYKRKLKIKTIVYISIELLKILKYIHSCGYLHRDLKSDNFVVGYEDRKKLYCIDFGLAKKFVDKSGNHIPFKTDKKFVGTARYASIASHNLQEQGRKDDLESLGYLFIYLFKGKLPWQNVKTTDKFQKHQLIKDFKINTTEEMLCKDMPKEFCVFLKYVRNMEFTEDPPYHSFIKMFTKLYKSIQLETSEDSELEWIKKEKK